MRFLGRLCLCVPVCACVCLCVWIGDILENTGSETRKKIRSKKKGSSKFHEEMPRGKADPWNVSLTWRPRIRGHH